jgi:hypothetical protein
MGLRELEIDYINEKFRNTIIFLSGGKSNFFLRRRKVSGGVKIKAQDKCKLFILKDMYEDHCRS